MVRKTSHSVFFWPLGWFKKLGLRRDCGQGHGFAVGVLVCSIIQQRAFVLFFSFSFSRVSFQGGIPHGYPSS